MKTGQGATLLCLAYIIGLLTTTLFDYPLGEISWSLWSTGAAIFLLMGLIAGLIIPRLWRTGPQLGLWLLAGLFGAFAILSFPLRIPTPEPTNIIHTITEVSQGIVEGKIVSIPRLTRSQKIQFTLETTQLNHQQAISGKVYVTVPLLQGTGLSPQQTVEVTGALYQPSPPKNPNGFNFQSYLARQGIFAGLRGTLTQEPQTQPWGWWTLRQRIVQAQIRWLGSPTGQMLSSIALGRRAVDLPYDIYDLFIQAGLAHIISASGFHVSLLLGIVLGLTRKFAPRSRLILGLITLTLYLSLTGSPPSVLRASLMGVAALLGLTLQRQVKSVGALLLVATVLLGINPIWIVDLGFQLSFLATLGLILTLPPLLQRLDWLPPTLANLIAIPLAAWIWTFPLQSYYFSVIPTYGILLNIIATPLILVVSFGGMISALAALIFPWAGSGIAWLFNYPTQCLITLAQFSVNLPVSSLAVGKMPLIQLLIWYGLMVLLWLNPWFQRRWKPVGLFALTLIILFTVYKQLNLVQITVLATSPAQIVVIQDRGNVTLINAGDENTAFYTVIPFLQQAGINTIDYGIALSNSNNLGWNKLQETLKVKKFLSFAPQPQSVTLKQVRLSLLQDNPPLLQLNLEGETWLLLDSTAENPNAVLKNLDLSEPILVWSGTGLSLQTLVALKPQVAIASGKNVDEILFPYLSQLYITQRDGAIQWTPQTGFNTMFRVNE